MKKSYHFSTYRTMPAATLRAMMRNWVDTYVRPRRREFDEHWDSHAIFDEALKVLMIDIGWQKAFMPPELGGWGAGNVSNIASFCTVVFEEMSRGDLGMNIAFASGYWSLLMVAMKPEYNMRLLADLAPLALSKDKLFFGGLFMTEPQGGSDIENVDLIHGRTIRTTARLDGDEWVINGHKLWPSNSGGVANVHGVVCTTNPGSSNDDDIAFIFVPDDLPGVTQGKPYEKAGVASDKNSDVWYEDVRVPAYYRALGPGKDALRYKEVMCLGMLTAIFNVGPLLDIYEKLCDFCARKTLHGRPLNEHEAVAAELAEIAGGIEACRSAVYSLAAVLDRPDLYGPRWSHQVMAKARLTKMFVADRTYQDACRAMNILQEYGADRQWDIEKHWRDMKMVQLWLGGKQLAQMEGARYFFDCRSL